MDRRSPAIVWLAAAVFTTLPALPATAHAQSIGELAEHAAVRRAFRAIDSLEATTIANHVTLTEIAAPPFMEGRRAERFAALLREAGADSVWIDEVGNVVALRRGRVGARTVALDAHLDTVFPEGTDVRVRRRGDTLIAPGIGDDTRGLSVVLTVLRAMNAANVETESNVLFIGTVGEEGLGDLRGVKHLFRQGGPRIDTWIGIDGVDPKRIVHRGLGSHRYRVTFTGPGGHSWGAFGLGNPHHWETRTTPWDLASRSSCSSPIPSPPTVPGPRTTWAESAGAPRSTRFPSNRGWRWTCGR